MPITKPQLPPKLGYVEVVVDNGEHIYKPTSETIEKNDIMTDTDSMLVDYELRLTLLELGVNE